MFASEPGGSRGRLRVPLWSLDPLGCSGREPVRAGEREGETSRRWGRGGWAGMKAEAARASKCCRLPAPSIRTDARARRAGSRAVRRLEVASAGKQCAVVDVRQGLERGL